MGKWIKIMTTGTHTDSAGREHHYTTAKLDKLASNYEARTEDAALVLGHPKNSDPAYGWLKQVRRFGEDLCAYVAQIPDTIRKAVDNKRYKYVSLSHTPDLRIRHVGLLGAVPPGVKGLGEVSFAKGEDLTTVDINFSEPVTPATEDDMDPALMEKRIKELEDRVKALESEVKTERDGKEKAEKELETAKAEFAEAAAERRRVDLESRVDKLIADGRVLPAQKAEVLAFCEAMDDGTEISFNEGDGKKTLVDHYLTGLEKQPDNGLLHEFSASDEPEASAVSGNDLARKF